MSSRVVILGTGGTIASTAGEDGASPELSNAELVEAVPELLEHATLSTEQVAQRPSFDMDFDTVAAVGRAVRKAAAGDDGIDGGDGSEGVDGVVITHGTDTMEESAYLLDLTLDVDVPIVFTGAQRRPDEPSADGPANLLTAVRAAGHDRLRSAGGVYVAFDEELHAARDVTKVHTRKLDTFSSPGKGPVAEFTRETVRFYRDPGSRTRTVPVSLAELEDTVPIVKSALGVDGTEITHAVERGADGVVLEATGLGNATAGIGDAVAAAVDEGVPVVVSSRCLAGSTAPVYGTAGGGWTLRDHGAVFADDLPAHKARLKLLVALAETSDVEEIRKRFAAD